MGFGCGNQSRGRPCFQVNGCDRLDRPNVKVVCIPRQGSYLGDPAMGGLQVIGHIAARLGPERL
jgi:hypothetical protein